MDIKKIVEEKESQILEFKKSLAEKKEILETISAFATADGGEILVGVEENKDGSVKEIVGVNVKGKVIESLTNEIKQNTDPVVFPSVKVEKINDKDILSIKIEEGLLKPVFAKGRAYKRVGKSNLKLTVQEIRKMTKESVGYNFTELVCGGAKLGDIDEEKIKRFLQKAKFERRLNINPEISIKEALERLNLIKKNKLTNAAVLLFGRNTQKYFLSAEVRCARFKGVEPVEFIDMKVFGGNIIDQREDAVEFVKEHIKLHVKIIDVERVETWEYPTEAIREAITNAICHRNYEIASNIQIRIFDDRIEVWSPGLLPSGLTVEKLKKKHESILRNPLIGKCFFLVKYIEQWGTGTNRIIKECIKHGLPEPIFEETNTSFIVTFRKYKITEEILKELNERQRKAVKHLLKYKKITNQKYRELNPNISDRTALNDFNELIKKNIIVAKGEKRYRYYILQ